jgi:hypothetical protein
MTLFVGRQTSPVVVVVMAFDFYLATLGPCCRVAMTDSRAQLPPLMGVADFAPLRSLALVVRWLLHCAAK